MDAQSSHPYLPQFPSPLQCCQCKTRSASWKATVHYDWADAYML